MGIIFDPKLKIEGNSSIFNWRRPAPNTIPWDTKASGLYGLYFIKHEAKKGSDSLMLDHEGNVAEATGANIFKDKIVSFTHQCRLVFRWLHEER